MERHHRPGKGAKFLSCGHFTSWMVEAGLQPGLSSAEVDRFRKRLIRRHETDSGQAVEPDKDKWVALNRLTTHLKTAGALESCRSGTCAPLDAQLRESMDDLFDGDHIEYPVPSDQPADVVMSPVNGANRREYVEVSAALAASGGDMEIGKRFKLGSRLTLKIPPDCADGAEFTYQGRGYIGTAGGIDGDLIVTVRVVRPQPGPNAEVRLQVPYALATSGGEATLVYSRGGAEATAHVPIPKGVEPGAEIVLANLGHEGELGASRGDLVVTVDVAEPMRGADVQFVLPVASWQAPLMHFESIAYIRDGFSHTEPNLVVPGGVARGTILRYVGLGERGDLPDLRGDLVLTVALAEDEGIGGCQ